MENLRNLDEYFEHLCVALGHADRRASLKFELPKPSIHTGFKPR